MVKFGLSTHIMVNGINKFPFNTNIIPLVVVHFFIFSGVLALSSLAVEPSFAEKTVIPTIHQTISRHP
jgi:hypothetical protein